MLPLFPTRESVANAARRVNEANREKAVGQVGPATRANKVFKVKKAKREIPENPEKKENAVKKATKAKAATKANPESVEDRVRRVIEEKWVLAVSVAKKVIAAIRGVMGFRASPEQTAKTESPVRKATRAKKVNGG